MSYFPPTGSTVAFQSDPTKLLAHASVSGNVAITNAIVNVAGSVAATGSVTTLQGTNPWVISNPSVAVMSVVPHSVATLQGTNPWTVQLTSGSVITTGGNSSVQVVGLMPPQSVSGVGTFNIDPQGAGSILAKLINSSVTAYQGATPWVVTSNNTSVIVANIQQGNSSVTGTMSVLGTVPVTMSGVWATSIVGAPVMVEDAAHTTGDRGLFVLGVRNDTVSSFTSANLDYGPIATDSQGRIITKPHAPVESSIVATASTVNAGFGTNQNASVRVLAAPGAGLKWYITDLNVSNTGSVATLVTLTDDSSNTLWKGIAPGGGGNNMPGLNTPIVSAGANTPLGLVSGTAASIVHIWVAGYKAP